MYRPEPNESAMHWALRQFGFVRPRQPPPPPSMRVIALSALAALLGLVLLVAGYAAGGVLLVPSALFVLMSLWRHRRAGRASPD
jgi:hypothetical protein